jgi:hypothetical protein
VEQPEIAEKYIQRYQQLQAETLFAQVKAEVELSLVTSRNQQLEFENTELYARLESLTAGSATPMNQSPLHYETPAPTFEPQEPVQAPYTPPQPEPVPFVYETPEEVEAASEPEVEDLPSES